MPKREKMPLSIICWPSVASVYQITCAIISTGNDIYSSAYTTHSQQLPYVILSGNRAMFLPNEGICQTRRVEQQVYCLVLINNIVFVVKLIGRVTRFGSLWRVMYDACGCMSERLSVIWCDISEILINLTISMLLFCPRQTDEPFKASTNLAKALISRTTSSI